MATSVTQYGITWTFGSDHTVGQYATGDYYVVENTPGGGVTITGISPSSDYSVITSATVTITTASPAVVTWSSHGMRPGQIIKFVSTGTLPSPILADKTYYVLSTSLTTNTFRFSGTRNGTAINTTDAGSGTITCQKGRVINGSMANPTAGTGGQNGFDSSMTTNKGGSATFFYTETLNVARQNEAPLSVSNSVIFAAGTSIVSSISNATAENRPQLKDAAVLTIVATAPSADSFRPPYVGTDKSLSYTTADLDYSKLKTYPAVASTPNLATVTGYVARPWIEINTQGPLGREYHPTNNQPNYGGDMSKRLSDCLLSLLLNYTDEEKEPLLVGLVQYGIDVYGAAKTGGNWVANGGHNMGRKMPLLLAGTVLNAPEILAYGDAGNYFIFQEDQQTFYVSGTQVTLTNGSGWDPDLRGHNRTVTITQASPAVINWTNHGLIVNSKVAFTTTGTLPAPFTTTGSYYVISDGLSANSFQLSTTRGGAAINTTTAGSGTHTGYGASPYVSGDIGTAEWGILHTSAPNQDNSNWNAIYREINYNTLLGHVLFAFLTEGVETAWNWPAFFDYGDRVKNDETLAQTGYYSIFANNMWDSYRNPPATPVLLSATINSAGTSITYLFDAIVTFGAGGNAGMSITPSAGAATLSYSSGSNTTSLVYSISRAISSSESVTTSYVQPGSGIVTTVGALPLESFTNILATNDSTVTFPAAMSNASRQRLFPRCI